MAAICFSSESVSALPSRDDRMPVRTFWRLLPGDKCPVHPHSGFSRRISWPFGHPGDDMRWALRSLVGFFSIAYCRS